MLELRELPVTVVRCVAEAGAIDALDAPERAEVLRVAPDEVLVVTASHAEAPAASVERVVRRADADALVVDATDGWTVWVLEGDRAADALARLSELPVTEGLVQGRLAGVPAKVLVGPSRIRIFAESMWREAVRRRILADCADLDVREVPDGSGAVAP